MVDHPGQQGERDTGFFVVLGEYEVTGYMKVLPVFLLLFQVFSYERPFYIGTNLGVKII